MSTPASRKLLVIALIMVVAATMIIAASDDNCGELCLAEPGAQFDSPRKISADQALGLIQANEGNPDFLILDVRTSSEYAAGHIEDAFNLDYYSPSFQNDLDMLDRDKTYLVYCRTGHRSGLTVDMMQYLGFEYVYDLSGGIEDWVWRLASPEQAE